MRHHQSRLSIQSCTAIAVAGFSSLGAGASAQQTDVRPDVADKSSTPTFAATDWPWWRGTNHDGIAHPQSPPLEWSDTANVIWKSPVEGRGHGSATVLGDQVFLAAADLDQQTESVLCFDRQTGERKWTRIVHSGGMKTKKMGKLNSKASFASSSVATDGERLFINFVNNDAAWLTALDLDGQILWQHRICDYVVHQGYGSSPTIFNDLVIASADNKSGGAIVAYNRQTGKLAWKHDRPKKPNYPSPVLLTAAGQQQLVFTGCDLVTSLDPATGSTLWEIEGATTECVTSTVTDGTHVFTSGGYPTNHVAAVAADGSGKIVWENQTRVYVPSMLQRDGYLYATLDAGVAMCIRCSDGNEMWKSRLGGTFSSSPVMVGDKIFATNESGETFIFAADPEQFKLIGKNKLGDNVFATPVFAGDRIYQRIAHGSGSDRQEFLYCLGN